MTKSTTHSSDASIIPYQELLGNYDTLRNIHISSMIIPYQELLGNYDSSGTNLIDGLNYTIPRAIREL